MKPFFIAALGLVLALTLSPTMQAAPFNVAQGATVTLSGEFFTEYVDWRTDYPDGSPASPSLIDSVVDGVFLSENTQWDQDTLWWDEWGRDPAAIHIDLGAKFWIERLLLQADNNDAYEVAYFDDGSPEWVRFNPLDGWGMMIRPEALLPDPVVTRHLTLRAAGGDNHFSISEFQAFGGPIGDLAVPEPGTILLLALGIGGLIGLRLRGRDG
ncbi:MAG: PEP-CTERM sorting domain-containing protein [Desulfococcaceae bacterium]